MCRFEINKSIKYTALDNNTTITRNIVDSKDYVAFTYNNNGFVYNAVVPTNRIISIMEILNSGTLHGKGSDITINIFEPNYKLKITRTFGIKVDDEIRFELTYTKGMFTSIGGKVIKTIISAF